MGAAACMKSPRPLALAHALAWPCSAPALMRCSERNHTCGPRDMDPSTASLQPLQADPLAAVKPQSTLPGSAVSPARAGPSEHCVDSRRALTLGTANALAASLHCGGLSHAAGVDRQRIPSALAALGGRPRLLEPRAEHWGLLQLRLAVPHSLPKLVEPILLGGCGASVAE